MAHVLWILPVLLFIGFPAKSFTNGKIHSIIGFSGVKQYWNEPSINHICGSLGFKLCTGLCKYKDILF